MSASEKSTARALGWIKRTLTKRTLSDEDLLRILHFFKKAPRKDCANLARILRRHKPDVLVLLRARRTRKFSLKGRTTTDKRGNVHYNSVALRGGRVEEAVYLEAKTALGEIACVNETMDVRIEDADSVMGEIDSFSRQAQADVAKVSSKRFTHFASTYAKNGLEFVRIRIEVENACPMFKRNLGLLRGKFELSEFPAFRTQQLQDSRQSRRRSSWDFGFSSADLAAAASGAMTLRTGPITIQTGPLA